MPDAKTVSLINMKGGVGKSTLTIQLASYMAYYTNWSKNVLVVDLDPQFNASQYLLGVHNYKKKISTPDRPTVWNVFEQLTKTPGIASKALLPADAILNVVTFRGGNRLDLLASRLELAESLKQPAGGKEQRLAQFLKKVKEDYDLIIIDCAPTESMLTTAAYLASDYILVPVKPEFLSTIGLPLLVRSLADFQDQYEDHKVELLGIVFNHTSNYEPEEARSKREVRAEAARHGWTVFNAEVTYSRSYPRGAREGTPIFNTPNAQQKQKTKAWMFAQEFATRIGL